MKGLLGRYECLVIFVVEIEIVNSKPFNITIFIPDATWSTKSRRGMTVTDLARLVLRLG